MNGFHDMNGWAWAMMAFGTVFWLSLLGLVVWVVVGAPHRRGAQDGDTPPSAREILDRRLARGEIGVDEYERALAAIGKGKGEQ